MSTEQETQDSRKPSAMLATRVNSALAFQPQSFGELVEFAKMIGHSGMVPKDYVNNPGAILVAIQMGAEVGLGPMAALQNIAVINGRPSVWGDAGLAIVKSHPDFVSIVEEIGDTAARCTICRRNEPDVVRAFSRDDAKQAGLLGKSGPWSQYPKRMLQMRARWLAMRDQFPDALRGIGAADEEVDVTPAPQTVNAKPKTLGDVVDKARAPTIVDVEVQALPSGPAKSLADVVAQAKAKSAAPKNEPPPPSDDDAPQISEAELAALAAEAEARS